MEQIKISIITSLYRSEKFLEKFLNYFFETQNLSECELILVHNDPTEDELKIINKFNWNSINLIHLKIEREGLYTSWNRAIKIARGEYLAIWNVDDIRTSNSLLSQKIALDQSSAAMCYGNFYGTSRHEPNKERLYRYCEFENFEKDALRHHVIGCFPMWRKAIHEKIGYFDEQFKLVSDYEFQLRVIANYKMVKAQEVLGYYLQYSNHKLGSNKFLQDTERAVVEFRYKYYDKVLMHTIPFIFKYQINKYLNFGKLYNINEVVPELKKVRTQDLLHFIQMPFIYFMTFSRRSVNKLYRILFSTSSSL